MNNYNCLNLNQYTQLLSYFLFIKIREIRRLNCAIMLYHKLCQKYIKTRNHDDADKGKK